MNLPPAPPSYDIEDQQVVRREVERAIEDLQRPVSSWTIPKVATLSLGLPNRTLTTISDQTEVREALITLIHDLRQKGFVQ